MKKIFLCVIGIITIAIVVFYHHKEPQIPAYTQARSAFLILDFQNDFTKLSGKMPVDHHEAEETITATNAIIDHAPAMNWEVVYIANAFSPSDLLNFTRKNAAIKGTDGANWDERLRIINANYFSKDQPDAFSNPKLFEFLDKHQVNHLYFSGLYAEACVLWTVKHALAKGYKVTIIQDAIASSTDLKRQAMIEKYKKMGVEVLSHKELISTITPGISLNRKI